ncbi:Na+/H+ antiporter subunit C [Negadavirga shengliensis]|jgi:multicomponent Na+:H+ antiporter subunit C|uniref:Na+/H+ antiporter subunit C n=1 Tax=Negadavirga shengliensis TaxID=1389218 RepID=A0ABV9T2R4_9BACT
MEILLAIIIGLLYAAGIYMMLRRSLVKLIIGLILLGNGANLLIFLLGRIAKGTPPIIGATEKVLSEIYADPVPQALILTAIVISFGLQAFAIILVKRAYKVVKTDDLDEMNATDEDL